MTIEKPDGRTQADKFRDAARELGCDEDEAKFDDALKRIARAPRKPASGAKDGDPKA